MPDDPERFCLASGLSLVLQPFTVLFPPQGNIRRRILYDLVSNNPRWKVLKENILRLIWLIFKMLFTNLQFIFLKISPLVAIKKTVELKSWFSPSHVNKLYIFMSLDTNWTQILLDYTPLLCDHWHLDRITTKLITEVKKTSLLCRPVCAWQKFHTSFSVSTKKCEAGVFITGVEKH